MNDIAKSILSTNTLMTLSTVSEDGSPLGTPVHFAYDDKNIYWFSFDASSHSVNIAHEPRIFITIFNSGQNIGSLDERAALYIATTAHSVEGDEERYAQDVFADRVQDDRPLGEGAHFYSAPFGELDEDRSNAQRIYYCFNQGYVA
ncbi:MAG: pyridoxamine 5'-phosphate oxidase family protein [Candidatus Saccharimonadales bacterium]